MGTVETTFGVNPNEYPEEPLEGVSRIERIGGVH